jgi:hypothetical protein
MFGSPASSLQVGAVARPPTGRGTRDPQPDRRQTRRIHRPATGSRWVDVRRRRTQTITIAANEIGQTTISLKPLTKLDDRFGHRWNVSQHLRDVPHDGIVAAAAPAFA